MNISIAPLIAGLAGTAAMTLLLQIPQWVGLGNIDIIRAAGALITRKQESAFLPGLIIHFGAGIIFAYAYVLLLSLSHIPINPLTGLFLGSLHGALIMLLVSIMILEHHPIATYHDRGPMTGFAQLLAHMVYGLIVGTVVQLLS
ncbi:MAG: hypothetical protein NT164_01550 [Verrucomicrobiae bacterium]|nr:hypothetical protein [Verrucomicrobiae bacterium]